MRETNQIRDARGRGLICVVLPSLAFPEDENHPAVSQFINVVDTIAVNGTREPRPSVAFVEVVPMLAFKLET